MVPPICSLIYLTIPDHSSLFSRLYTMGVSLSLLAPQAQTVALRSYIDILPGYVFLEVVNDSRFLKTIKAYDVKARMPVLIKVFIKPQLVGIKLQDVSKLLSEELTKLAPYPNFLPCFKLIEMDLAGYMVRQLVRSNLYDRLSLRPFLSYIEKLWILFQLLKMMDLLHHHLEICHGDIKTENILVTSSNWLLLSDFSGKIKPTYIPDDNPTEFVFYFDSSDRRTCYLAPERFLKKDQSAQADKSLTPEMDLFSLGCVIAELYLDGDPTFTLSDLFKYRKGEFEPNLSAITNKEVRDIVSKLLSLDPKSRPSAHSILEDLRGTVFPEHFYDFLFDLMSSINNVSGSEAPDEEGSLSDFNINRIYGSFGKIAEALGFETGQEEYIHEDFPYLKLKLRDPLQNSSSHKKTENLENGKGNESALIVLNLVSSLIGTLEKPESKIKACELILVLSENISDEDKLDRALPYLCSLLDEYVDDASLASERQYLASNSATNSADAASQEQQNFAENANISTRVACTALFCLTNVLESCKSLNAINANIFPEYILPCLKNVGFLASTFVDEVSCVRSALASCLPYLARTANRFYILSRNFQEWETKAKLPNEEEQPDKQRARKKTKARLFLDFKDLTETLLTDPSVGVRISLLQHILPLCHFFGADKTNDLILPHLITYLNDSSHQLRLAFLASILQIGPFIGALSFEQYLSPLLFQALGDHEPLVVLKVLEIFYSFLKERLINHADKFNVLSVYREVLSNCVTLLLQPNEWIRQSVLNIIIVIAENLLEANKFCFLYPIIKSYLSYDVSSFTWDSLYPCLTKPLSPQVYTLSILWSSSATSKSLFWKQTSATIQHGTRKLITFNKEMGKSVFIPQTGSNNNINIDKRLSDIPLSSEDRQWILKLRSVGLDERDLWKVFALKSHFISYNRSKQSGASSDHTEFDLAGNMNLPPLTIFFDVSYKSESITGPYRKTETSVVPESVETSSILSRGEQNSLLLPGTSKAKASLQTFEANVLGELETNAQAGNNKKSHHSFSQSGSKNLSHRVFSVNDQRIISASMRHNYEGSNSFIRGYLRTIKFKPNVDDFAEFGHIIKGNPEGIAPREMSIKDILVAQVNTNTESSKLDAITKLAVSPTSEFFVTGSESGSIKVWDASKLDKNVISRNASLTSDLGATVTDIVFMPHRFVFAVLTEDGYIRIFRVQVTRNKNHRIIKYLKLLTVRTVKVEKGYPLSLELITTNAFTTLVTATSSCQIIGYDVITMKAQFQLQNPLRFGEPTSMVISRTSDWLLVGSSDGALTLWDLRFKVRVKSWHILLDSSETTRTPIRKLMLVPASSRVSEEKKSSVSAYVAVIGGTGESDITIWEVPTFHCCQIYTANENNPRIKTYSLKECDPVQEMKVEDLLADFTLDSEESDRSFRALAYVNREGINPHMDGYFVLVTHDSRVIVWNLQDISESILMHTEKPAAFSRMKVNLGLEMAYERQAPEKRRTIQSRKGSHDAVNDIAVIYRQSYMVITAERNGTINIYR